MITMDFEAMRKDLNDLRQACREEGTPRIQEAIDRAESRFDCLSPNATAEIEALKASEAKLREALEHIRDMKPHHAGQTVNEFHMQNIARAALSEKGA